MDPEPSQASWRPVDKAAPPLAALTVICLALLAALGLIVDHSALPVDLQLASAIGRIFPDPATRLFDLLGTLPVVAVVAGLAAAVCWVRGRRAIAGAFVVGLCAEAAVTLVKVVVDRPRPLGAGTVGDFITYASFPSGHTVRAVVIAGLLISAFAPRDGPGRWIAVAAGAGAAIFVGLARVASGEHWPTDVLGGLLLGIAWLGVALLVRDGLAARRR